MCIESPRKARYHSTERRSMISCLPFRITNAVLLKCQNLLKTKEKLKENLKPTHPYRKAPFSGVRPHRYATVSFSTKSTLEGVFEKLRFWHHFRCIRMDDNRIHNKKVVFSCGRGLNKVAVARF